MIFLIDFKHGKNHLLDGADLLRRTDTIHFFWSYSWGSIQLSLWEQILKSRCEVKHTFIDARKYDAVDTNAFIAWRLGALAALDNREDIAIISENPAIRELEECACVGFPNSVSFYFSTIAGAISQDNSNYQQSKANAHVRKEYVDDLYAKYVQENQLRRKRFDVIIKDHHYEDKKGQIEDILDLEFDTKEELHNLIIGLYGKQQGEDIYQMLLVEFPDDIRIHHPEQ